MMISQGRCFSTPRRTLLVQAQTKVTSIVLKPPYKNVGPEPKRFAIEDGQCLNIASAFLPAILRAGAGAVCAGYRSSLKQDDGKYSVVKFMGRKLIEESDVGTFPRPASTLILYEFEGCPYCKKVREAMSMLDLDVEVRPCPRNGDRWRPEVVQRGGRSQFPFLVDPNTGKEMYESDKIVKYLFSTYGNGQVPAILRMGPATTIPAAVGLAVRCGKGNRAVPSHLPTQPLVLWGYEASPFVKVVREVLCERQLHYLYRNCARGSPKREELLQKYGHFQVPCLEDPNTESYLFESAAIIRYLEQHYSAGGAAPTPSASQQPSATASFSPPSPPQQPPTSSSSSSS